MKPLHYYSPTSNPTQAAKYRTIGMSLAIFSLLSASGHSAVTANFTGGNGNTSPDQYSGTAGNGWAGGWQTNTDASVANPNTLAATVTNTTPLAGGGNYLSATFTGGSGTSKGVVNRQYDDSNGLNLDETHTISFDFRLDSELSSFTSTGDYIQIFDRPSAFDFGADGSWLIRATGATVGGITARTWMFYNGAKNGGAFSSNNFVSSGVQLVPGTVYHFEIEVNPADLTYNVSINGGPASADLGFRANSAANLGTLSFGGQVSNGGEVMRYSVDSVSVIPEPSAALLGALGTLALLRRRRD